MHLGDWFKLSLETWTSRSFCPLWGLLGKLWSFLHLSPLWSITYCLIHSSIWRSLLEVRGFISWACCTIFPVASPSWLKGRWGLSTKLFKGPAFPEDRALLTIKWTFFHIGPGGRVSQMIWQGCPFVINSVVMGWRQKEIISSLLQLQATLEPNP